MGLLYFLVLPGHIPAQNQGKSGGQIAHPSQLALTLSQVKLQVPTKIKKTSESIPVKPNNIIAVSTSV